MSEVERLRVVYELNDAEFIAGMIRMKSAVGATNSDIINASDRAEKAIDDAGNAAAAAASKVTKAAEESAAAKKRETEAAQQAAAIAEQTARETAKAVADALKQEADARKVADDAAKKAAADASEAAKYRAREERDAARAVSEARQREAAEKKAADDAARKSAREAAEAAKERARQEKAAADVVVEARRKETAAEEAARKAASGRRASTQNTSYQIQDIAVQIANGTSASTAFGQQLPQLLGGLGALGAVIGAVVAVGVPLAAAFLGAGDAAKELADSIDKLKKAQADYDAAAKDSAATAADLAGKFGSATAQAQDLYDRIARLQYLAAVDAVGAAITKLSANFEDLQGYLNSIDSEIEQFGSASPVTLENAAISLKEQFGLTVDQAREFLRLLSDAQAAQSIQDKAAKLNEIAVYLDNAVRSTGDANAQMRELARNAAEGALESYELAKSSDDLSLSMKEASDAASTVAASVAGIDFSNAVAGANQLVAALQSGMAAIAALEGQQATAMRRAQIARDFAGDKVGAAGATGALDFNSAYDAANPYQGPLTREMQADIDARREAYIEGEKDLARIQEETQTRMKAIADAGRRSGGARKSSGGGRTKKEKEAPDVLDSADREIQQLERQIAVLGKSSEETARLQAKWAMLDAAKKAGIPVNDALNAQIETQAAKVGDLTQQLENNQLQQARFEQAVDGIAGAFSDALVAGESLREGLAQVFKQIASDILSSGIRDALTSVLKPTEGGGGFWSTLGSAIVGGLSGKRASGGPVRSGSAYLVNENTPNSEVFVPSVNGAILNVAQAQAALRDQTSGSGGSVDVRVFMDEGGNWQARVEQISGNVAAKAVSTNSRREADKQYLRGGR